MKKFEKILLCSDLDGTLMGPDGKLSEANKEALGYFMDNGGTFTLATGRNYTYIEELLNTEGLRINAPLICLNGAMVYDTDKRKIIRETPLDRKYLYDFGAFLEKNKNYFTGVTVHFEASVDVPAQNAAGEYEKIGDRKVYKFVFRSHTQEDSALFRKAFVSLYGGKYFVANSWATGFEVLDPEATKGNGVRLAAQLLGNGIRTVAVGDFENDITMLEKADLSFAVQNAAPEVRAAADIVTVSNGESPFIHIISEIEKAFAR